MYARLDNSGAKHDTDHKTAVDIDDAVAAEAGDGSDEVSRRMDRAVQWQLENHRGFLDAFISSIRHAPISGQHADWKLIGERQRNRHAQPEMALWGGKTILVLGETDPIVVREEVDHDAREAMGCEHVCSLVLQCGHDVPVSRADELADRLWQTWIQLAPPGSWE